MSNHTQTAHQRGYTYRWTKAAERFRRSNPLCKICLEIFDKPVPAECVDHVIPHKRDKEAFWDVDNWQPLCKRCHDLKSWRESQGLLVDWKPLAGRYAICGRPASGKTTMAGELHQRYPSACVWDLDVEAAKRGLGIGRHRTQRQVKALTELRKSFMRRIVQGEECAIVIASSAHTAFAIARQMQGTLVHCWCPEDERQRRLMAR